MFVMDTCLLLFPFSWMCRKATNNDRIAKCDEVRLRINLSEFHPRAGAARESRNDSCGTVGIYI